MDQNIYSSRHIKRLNMTTFSGQKHTATFLTWVQNSLANPTGSSTGSAGDATKV